MLVDFEQQTPSQNVKIPIFSEVTDHQLSTLRKLTLIRSCFLHIIIGKNPPHIKLIIIICMIKQQP